MGSPIRGKSAVERYGAVAAGAFACAAALLVVFASVDQGARAADPAAASSDYSQGPQGAQWWPPSSGWVFPAKSEYPNAWGKVGILNADGPVNTAGHPFFTPLGSNGRACVTCHQPKDGMGLALTTIQARWAATGGKDPMFAAIDGSNCPTLPQGPRANHSLLLEHGLFRVSLPWPPRTAAGAKIDPDFTIQVVRDPTTCNLDPTYGLHSANPAVSVFRRPRATANMHYITASYALLGERGRRFNNKTGEPLDIDPETGQRVGLPIMFDGREPTLVAQARDAVATHMQAEQGKSPTLAQFQVIEKFLNQLYVAQAVDKAGDQFGGPGSPSDLGPEPISVGKTHVSGDNWATPVFGTFDAWDEDPPHLTASAKAFRESVKRGYAIFTERPIWIGDVAHFNSIGMGSPYKRNCTICHSTEHIGSDTSPGVMDLGTSNEPWAGDIPYLPLFKLTCKADALPHAYLGRVVYTHDPGRALITGHCEDIGAGVMQQMRGLAARAPYFSNGTGKDIAGVVDFYNKRFDMKLKPNEKADLINFLSVL